MHTRLRVERYRGDKKMKLADQIAQMPFGDLTNIHMSGIFHKYPLSFCIFFYFLDDVADNSKIYELPMSSVIQTPSDYQALHEKMSQETSLRVQRCWQNKDIRSFGRKSQMPLKDVSKTLQSGTVLFHYTSCSRHPGFMLSSFNDLVYL
jgi:hypothetical protein